MKKRISDAELRALIYGVYRWDLEQWLNGGRSFD